MSQPASPSTAAAAATSSARCRASASGIGGRRRCPCRRRWRSRRAPRTRPSTHAPSVPAHATSGSSGWANTASARAGTVGQLQQRHGADDSAFERLLDAGVVDVEVGHQPHRAGGDRAGEHAVGGRRCSSRRRGVVVRGTRRSSSGDVGRPRRRRPAAAPARGRRPAGRRGRARRRARRRRARRLPHRAAEALALDAGRVDQRRRRRPAASRPARRAPSTGSTSPSSPARRRSAAGTPVATSALNSRAPSRCTGSADARPRRRARSSGHGRPPDGMCVSSTHTADTGSQWCGPPASTYHATSAGSSVPSASSTVVQLRRAVHAEGAVLVGDDVRAPTGDRPPCPARRAAAGRSGCPSSPTARTAPPLADPLGEGLLERPHRRVLAVAVVADLGLGHRPPHRRRRPGDGVGAEIDDARARHVRVARDAPADRRAARPAPSTPPPAAAELLARARPGHVARADGPHEVDGHRHGHRDGPRLRGAAPRAAARRPARRRLPRRGDRRDRRHQRRPLGRRPARRHHQLPLRPPRLQRVGRRRGRGRRASSPSSSTPSLGDVFTAVRGGGARRNGAPIACSTRADDLATALCATGFAYDPARRRAPGRRARPGPRPGPRHPARWAPPPSTCARSPAAGSTPTGRRGLGPLGPRRRQPHRREAGATGRRRRRARLHPGRPAGPLRPPP